MELNNKINLSQYVHVILMKHIEKIEAEGVD